MAHALWTRKELAVPISSARETAGIAANAWRISDINANVVVKGDKYEPVSRAGASVIRPPGIDGIATANGRP
jgi:hypothetical protein